MSVMFLNYLSPYVRFASDDTEFPPASISRVIFDYELIYLKNGQALVTILDKTYHAVPGDIILLRPRIRHTLATLGDIPVRQPHIHFDFFYRPDSPNVTVNLTPIDAIPLPEMKFFRDDILDDFIPSFPDRLHLDDPSEFENILFQIIHEYEQRNPFFNIVTKGLFLQLWAIVLEMIYISENKTPPLVVNRIKEYLEQNLDREVVMDELSRIFHLNSIYLSRIFKKSIGISPKQYHTMARINKAKEMIQNSKYSLSEIAYRLGFSGIHSFSRYFKNEEGIPPSSYRD
jgi:AraC-like DNA-binding protein